MELYQKRTWADQGLSLIALFVLAGQQCIAYESSKQGGKQNMTIGQLNFSVFQTDHVQYPITKLNVQVLRALGWRWESCRCSV